MRKSICILLCLIIMFFTGCGGRSENELPKDVKAISTEWQNDQLLYATSDGIFAYSPSDGITESLMSDEISAKDINRGILHFIS